MYKEKKDLQEVMTEKITEELNKAKNHGHLVCCPDNPKGNVGKVWKVFLAGPIQGAPEWQFDVPDIDNVIFLSPRRKTTLNFDYKEQVDWERIWMNYCDVILMWIPKEAEHVEGRSYAQTTRTEFGEYLSLGKKIIFGCYDDFSGKRYFQSKLNEYDTGSKALGSFDECISELKSYIKECEKNPGVWFTSDTHFCDPRAWELSRRPFKSVDEMDKVMIRKWNDNVKPCDTIYHLGDFSKEPEKVAPYLNGKKILVYGNYERDGKYEVPDGIFDKTFKQSIIITVGGKKYCLCHEPIRGRNVFSRRKNELYGVMFGHIHARGRVKKFNAVDVGVDGNFFKPMSIDDCNFFINAVHKGYYDQEVWAQ